MKPARRQLAVLAAALLLPVAGCWGDGTGGGPLDVQRPDAGWTAAPPPTAPPTAKRQVLRRNPFGNVAQAGNLLFDGDFELASLFADQYGWLSGISLASLSFQLPDIVIGPRCRSGLKCAELAPGHAIAGLGVASRDSDLAVSLWANVAEGGCDEVEIHLLTEDFADPTVLIPPQAVAPTKDRWCRYEALVGERQANLYLVVQNLSDGVVLVDDAVIVRQAEAGRQGRAAGGKSPSSRFAARLQDVRRRLREARRPRDLPPNEALKAFSRRFKR